MILAAGLGTRLRPLTNRLPKALVPVAGVPMLEILLQRMELAGFTQVAVNAHHVASQVKDFLVQFRQRTTLQLYYSYEPIILNTGGGIKKMLDFFADETPILVHNVDILTALDYGELVRHHIATGAQATLVIHRHATDRPLTFDSNNQFLGRAHRPMKSQGSDFSFCGIQVIQPSLFRTVKENIFYSIDLYVKAAASGEIIKGYDISGQYWRDIGTLDDLEMAARDIKQDFFQLP